MRDDLMSLMNLNTCLIINHHTEFVMSLMNSHHTLSVMSFMSLNTYHALSVMVFMNLNTYLISHHTQCVMSLMNFYRCLMNFCLRQFLPSKNIWIVVTARK